MSNETPPQGGSGPNSISPPAGSASGAGSTSIVPAPNAAVSRELLSMSGPQKALLFLLSLDEPVAASVIKLLSESELRTLRAASEKTKQVSPSAVHLVHREFAERAKLGITPTLEGSTAYLRKLAARALGDGAAAAVFADEQREPAGAIVGRLDTDTLAAILEEESAQTAAVVLSRVSAARAAEVVARTTPERRVAIVQRLARLEAVPDDVIQAIEAQLAAEIPADGAARPATVDGLEVAAALVKRLGREDTQALLSGLAETDSHTAEKIKKALFTFEDLRGVDARGMQALLKSVATDQLVIALKTASAELREKILGSLSSRAAGMLREELDLLGAVRITDVENAQAAIVDAALELEGDGTIQIRREGENDFV
jgi:flagellar motor switch protein FliG